MKNNFQSKAVPRGTRTIWRYLSALFILFTFAIGNVWAELTAHTPGTYEKAIDKGGYGATIVTVAERDYEVYGFSYNSSGAKPQILWAGTSTNNASASQVLCSNLSATPQEIAGWISMSTAGKSSTYSMPSSTEFAASSVGSSGLYQMKMQGHSFTIKVKGYDQFSFLGNDNNGTQSKNKYMQVTINGSDVTKDLSSSTTVRRYDLNASIESTIVITGLGTSNEHIDAFSLRLPEAPTCSTEITTQPSGATLAIGDANPELSIVATNVASYAWKESSNGTSYDGVSSLGSSASFTPSVNDAVQTKYYYCEVTSSCDGAAVSKSNIVTVNVVGAISYYTVTLNPAGGTIVDATGWTLNAGNYEKEVAEGTVLTLPTFTKTDRTFKTWRKAGPADVASPVTVDGDLSLTAIWTATIEQVIYSWEGAEGGATEVGGTAQSSTNGGSSFDDAQINVPQAGYYCIQLNGKNDYSTNLVEITLSGDEKVKTGDKIKYTGFYNNADTKNAAPKMRAADGTAIFSGSNLPNITTSEPRTDTHVVPSGINTATVQLTRAQTQSSSFLANLQIIRDVQVEEGDLLTVTFNSNGGSAIAPVMVASGQAVAKPADPTKAHNRFKEWQLSGSAYNFSTPVTASITLDAVWNPLYTVTYAANGGSGTMTDANEYAAGDEVTLLTNTFDAPDASKIWDSWAVTDASDNSVAVSEGKFAMPNSAATVTAQWATISDFDVKFFQGYGDPDVQIGTTQTVSTGNYATAPAEDPERTGYRFLGWSYDATVEHIVNVSEYAITATTNFTAMWIQQFAVTFDGAGEVLVDNGATVASPNSPSQAGKVFQGWYNAEVKYDFSAAVTGNLALTSKWATADPNHFYYTYNDDFHFDGVVYKTPEGKVDNKDGVSNKAITTPYTLFSGAEGITSIVATGAIYDSKSNWVNAYLKLNTDEGSYLTFTIKSGYTAVLKMKMGGYSANPTVTLKKGEDVIAAESGTIGGVASTENNFNEITYNLVSGTYTMTTATKTLYISHIDLEATALPTHSVTYKPGDGEGAWVVDADATEVADCPGTFTAPTGKVFNGWKNESDDSDVAVGAIVEDDMNLIAQWINHYAVTFNMNGHGDAIDPQDIKEGAKATKPADPSESGWIFGGWFTDNGTFEAPFDFNTLITAATPLYAKWTEDPCPTPFSLSKVVLTSASDGTVTGYNNDEYAGEKVIGGLSGTQTAEVDPSHEGTETGYKLNSGGSAIVFATLKKGTFQEGDRVVVTITKKQDAYKVEEVAQPILDIYYGTNKDDATFLTTIDNVTAAGSYTYRLTAADVTAIGTKKGIGVFRPSSGRTQNPYVYSVEIQGCRSWAVSHGVTFNMMDHGTQVAPQTVPEGDKIAKPSVVEPEGWAFAGWYKESTLENEWDFTTDVMGTSDMTLYAKWESEVGVIKLFSSTGDLNTTNFVSAAKADDPIEIDEVPYPTLVAFGSNRSDLKGTTPADMVQYNATTNAAKIKLDLYNNASGTKSAYLWMVEEGDETATPIEISIPGKERVITSYYTFNSEKNRSFYLTSGAKSDIKVLQVKVMDNGTAIHQFGQAGYEVNLNKGRISAASAVAIPFEGAIISADAYSVLNSSSLKPKNYIQFNNAVANTIVKITKASSNKYYVTNDLENKGDEYSTDKEIVLTTTGTWYIGSVNPGSMAAFTKIEFLVPKCEQPAITPMSNSDLCEGNAFEALTVTASVSDGGTLHYAWFKEAGADDEAVGTDAASYTPDADGQYYVVVTNQLADHSDNSATSNTITVTHYGAPVITSAPLNKRGEVDDVVTLTVAATGKNVSYKWYTCDEDGSNEVALDPAETGTSLNVTVTAGMNQWYKVIVTSDCGNAEAKAKVSEFQPTTPATVTESIVWDWTSSVWPASGTAAFTNEDAPDYELLADADAIVPNAEGFRSDMLYGKGQYVWRSGNKFFQGTAIKFTSIVAGMVRVYFRSTKEGRTVNVAINGTDAGSRTNSFGWSSYVEVPAGEVEILCTGDGYTRIQKIEFLEIIDSRTEYAAKDLGTACYEYDALVIGATPYIVAGVNGNGYIVFDEITSGVIDAGYPYLFEAAGGKVFFCKPVGTTAAPLVSGEETSVKGMVGTFTGTTLTQGDDDICYFSGRHIWRVNDFSVDIDVDPHRCYVNYDVLRAVPAAPAAAPGRRRVIMGVNGKDEAQGFENLNASETPMKVMIDGTLYILRGEKVFDATGRLVK